ncbi:Protein WAPL-1 a [Aphelenchoides avenae]|nr:Protein WAPL-1 a [Aphelenchus avenae]
MPTTRASGRRQQGQISVEAPVKQAASEEQLNSQLSPEGSSACPDILPEKAISPPESQGFESSDGSDSENDVGPAKPATAGNGPAPSQPRKRESDEAMEVPDDIAFKKPALPAARKLPQSPSKAAAPTAAARPKAPVTRPKVANSTRPVYRHSWNPDSDDEDEAEKEDDSEPSQPEPAKKADPYEFEQSPTTSSSAAAAATGGTFGMVSRFSRFGKPKYAQKCLESGEMDDFKQELDYIMGTLADEKATVNLKCLSAIQLARKCISSDFRRFVRAQNMLPGILAALKDSHTNTAFAIFASLVIYFHARDPKGIPVTRTSVHLLNELLKLERKPNDADFRKHLPNAWALVTEWREKSTEKFSREIQFALTESTFSVSFLILEALAYTVVREAKNAALKDELLNVGCLQWLVARVDKVVLSLAHSAYKDDGETMLHLKEVERCFRIFEAVVVFNKKNQAFLMAHRNGLLLHSCAKFMEYFHTAISKCTKASDISKQLLDCVCLLSRVLMNLSHENDACSTKLGQINGFFRNCVCLCTDTAQQYTDKENHFDITVAMCGLLVNLAERSSSNRAKIVSLKVPLFEPDTADRQECSALEALTKLFLRHEANARSIDEDLDNDLMLEEPDGDEDDAAAEPSADDNGRLRRPVELTEDEIVNAVQGAMNKASAHMEDSMIASYLSLFIGCLVQTEEKYASEVKAVMPDGRMTSILEQLQRFLEFMKITNLKPGALRSIERIAQALEMVG